MTQTSPEETRRALAAKARRARRKEKIRNTVGLIVLLGAFLWSTLTVAWRTFGPRSTVGFGGAAVIRFAHWQLEGDTVKALDEMGLLYEQKKQEIDGEEVRVVQIPVPERVYKQWVRTRLIGDSAPDLIEIRNDYRNMIVKYFRPISDMVDQPNPWNEKLLDLDEKRDPGLVYPENRPKLVGVPWRDTYIDDMQGSWDEVLQEFYGMPMSVFTIRIFANADLISEATGMSKAELREFATGTETLPNGREVRKMSLQRFLDMCAQIREYAERTGRKGEIVPIAGSQYIAKIFQGRYWNMATFSLLDALDDNYDGTVVDAERIEAIFTGDIDVASNPAIAAAHKVLYDITREFNQGFIQALRDESLMFFIQERAAMIATGSWEVGSLFKLVKGEFDIMVFDFPVARPEEKYGEFITERASEGGQQAGFAMGVTQGSRYQDLAIDFMHFLTSRPINERLNKAFKWFPAIRGAGYVKELDGFAPRVEGVFGGILELHLGVGQTKLKFDQAVPDFLGKAGVTDIDAHYKEYIRGIVDAYQKYAIQDFRQKVRDQYNAIVQTEETISSARARALREDWDPGGELTRSDQRGLVATLQLIQGQADTIAIRENQVYLVNQVERQTGGAIQKPRQSEEVVR